MDKLQLWSLGLGFVAPIVLAFIQQPKWSDRTRALITFGFSILVGAGNVYFNGDLSKAADWTSAILIVLIAAISTYKGFWKPTQIAPAIEEKTSPTEPSPPH